MSSARGTGWMLTMLAVGVLGLDGVFLGFLAWHRARWTLALLAGASFVGVALVLGAWRRHQRILNEIIREREALAHEARTLRELGAGRSSQR